MKRLGLLLLVSLFIGCVYFSVNSTFAVAGDEEPAPNWIAEETMPDPESVEMDSPEDYDPQEGEAGDEEDAPDVDQAEGEE